MNVREVSESAGPTAEELDAVLDTLLWMASRPYDDPVEDAAALSYVWTLLQVEKRPRSQARSWADACRRLAHDLLSLRDADPAAYRALMARLDADQGGNR